MKIGFYLGHLVPPSAGGAYTFVESILNALQHINTHHEFYFFYKSPKDIYPNNNFINIANPKGQTLEKIPYEYGIELIYYLTPQFIPTTLPYIATVWDLAHRILPVFPEFTQSGWTYEAREKHYTQVLSKASMIVTGNMAGASQIEKYYNINPSLIKTIPMPTPDYVYKLTPNNSILEENNLSTFEYYFYPAQFWPHKNHIRILQAIKNTSDKVVFTGSDKGNISYIKSKVAEYGLENQVLFLGFVEKEELISLYKNAKGLIYASYLGPDNIPPLEAMALDCPVICADYDGAKEQLGDAALFFNPQKTEELLFQMNLLQNNELKNSLIKKGRIVAQNCNCNNYAAQMLNLIDTLVPMLECLDISCPYIHL